MQAGELGQRGAIGRLHWCVGAKQEIRAAVEQIGDDRTLVARRHHARQQVAQWREQDEQRRVQHETRSKIDDLTALLPMKAKNDPLAGTADGEIHATPFAGSAGHQSRDRRVGESCAPQCGDQQVPLVVPVGLLRPVL